MYCGMIRDTKGRMGNLGAQTEFRFHFHLPCWLSLILCASHSLFIMHPHTPCAGLVISHYARSHLGNWAMQSRVMYARGGEAQWPASLSISPNPLATENTYLLHFYLDFTNVDISEHNHCYPAISASTGAWSSLCNWELRVCEWWCYGSQHVLLTLSLMFGLVVVIFFLAFWCKSIARKSLIARKAFKPPLNRI